MIFVTGGAGFIGSNFVLDWLLLQDEAVLNIDKLTYAGNLENLASLKDDGRHVFAQEDICDQERMSALFARYQPRAIVHFAAESHVDRSILGPAEFVRTNVNGTFSLLEAAKAYWISLSEECRSTFRFLHVSTDEVYGTLGSQDPAFAETTAYAPNSPYAASKAAADHLVRSYHHTYGLPTLTTNCSNNYGPFHFPEKLIPLIIANAVAGKPLPIYGDGQQVRDWLYVADHCAAVRRVLEQGTPGETYNIGGCNEKTNLEVVETICGILDALKPGPNGPYAKQITFVADRPGHDRRYAINADKIRRQLDWQPAETFDSGICKTVQWYLDHPEWVDNVQSGRYMEWMHRNYGDRKTVSGKVIT